MKKLITLCAFMGLLLTSAAMAMDLRLHGDSTFQDNDTIGLKIGYSYNTCSSSSSCVGIASNGISMDMLAQQDINNVLTMMNHFKSYPFQHTKLTVTVNGKHFANCTDIAPSSDRPFMVLFGKNGCKAYHN